MDAAFDEIESPGAAVPTSRQARPLPRAIMRCEGLCPLKMLEVRQELLHGVHLLQGLGRQLERLAEEGSQT